MKRFIAICGGLCALLLLSNGVFASKAEFATHYDRGLELFNQQRFEDARGELFLAMALNEDDPQTLKHLAIASFMVEDYPQARNLAAQYLDISRDADIMVLMGRASELNGDYQIAANIYNRLATTSNPHQDAARQALNQLAKDRQGLFPRPEGFHGKVTAALENDSNIATTYDEPIGTPSYTKDTRTSLLFAADYDVPVKDRFFAGVGGLVFGNLYRDDGTPFETALFRGNLHAGMVGKGWSLKGALELDRVDYGHDKEFDAARLTATFIKLFNNRFVVLVQGSVADEDWAGGKSDSVRYDVAVDTRAYFNEFAPNTYLQLKYNYQLNDTDETSTQAYSFDKGTIGFKATFPALGSFYLYPAISFERRTYQEPMPTARQDDMTEVSVVLGKGWTKALSTELQYRYSVTDSNISLFDKKQRLLGLSVTSTF